MGELTSLNLNNKIRLEIVGTKIIIENLDIDFEIELNNEKKPNTAKVTIWNLSEETKSVLKNYGTGVKIYYSEEDRPLGFIFEGVRQNKVNMGHMSKPRKSTAKRPRKRKPPHWISKTKDPRVFEFDREGGDTSMTIELVESYHAYINPYYSKSYDIPITSDRLIKDIASSMNLSVNISSNIKHKTYLNGRAFHQSASSALTSICDAIGARWHIVDNNTILVRKIKETKPSSSTKYVYEFDSSDIDTPEFEDDNKVKFITKLITNLRPDDWVKLNTRNISGSFRICKIEMNGSNYSAENSSEITIKDG